MKSELFRIILVTSVLMLMPGVAIASDAAWRTLQAGGAIALLRHTRAPGTGDPSNFDLNDCATQRNLSAEGRAQARNIGLQFGEKRVPVERVLSSRWCRALETARLAFGMAEGFPPLDSFFAEREQEERQTQAVRATIQAWRSPAFWRSSLIRSTSRA